MSIKTFCAVVLTTTCLCPLTAGADEGDFDLGSPLVEAPANKPVLVNEAGIGFGIQAGGQGRYDRYGGGREDGAFGSAWFRMQERATSKEGGTSYFQAEGDDLEVGNQRVLPDASLRLRFGEQGVWDSRLISRLGIQVNGHLI